MAEFAALPVFVDAWALDCSHLTDAEDGRYWRLIRLMWAQPECRIPNDDAWIARKMNRTPEDVARDIRPLVAEFCHCDGNWITQKRLQKEWCYVRAKSRANSVAAKSRWQKEKHASERNAGRHSERNAPSPSPSPSPTLPPTPLTGDDGFGEFWKVYPRRVGKGQARKAYAVAIKKIEPCDLLTATYVAATAFSKIDPKFIPHPATWLNGERWADEPAPTNGAGKRTVFSEFAS